MVGFAGSFYAYEGLDLLIEAVALLSSRQPDLRVLLVGGGPQEQALRALGRDRGLADRVIFTGRVPHAEVQRYYELIDVLAYPRHRMRLTEIVTPLKPLEAMAQGRMFVASDVGGHRELVRDGETGFLFPAGDAQALAQTIESRARPAASEWPRDSRAGAPRSSRPSARGRAASRATPTSTPHCCRAAGDRPRAPAARGADRACAASTASSSSTASPAPAEALRRMGRVTIHRGPDDEGGHVDGPLAFGMRRLSIIDLDGGHQPLSNEDGTLWLVANGEIYNYRELRRDLIAQGHRFRTGSDCETILHLYEQYGDDFVDHLNGMFAFALWDARRRRLLVGRDRLGIKPHLLAQRRTTAAVRERGQGDPRCPRREGGARPGGAVASTSRLGYVPAPQSIFRGIRKLPPATLLIAEGGRVEERRYWRVPPDDRRHAVRGAIGSTAVRARLEESVRMQMVSDVPIGAFLSGGVDSSAVVAFMSAHSDRPVKTYAIGFGGGDAEAYYNELPFARQVAQRFGTDHHEILVRPDVVSLLPRLLWHMDEPIADTAFITTYLVSEFARRDVTVILSGVGGDELFGGYRRYLGNHYQAYFDRLPPALRRAALALGERLPERPPFAAAQRDAPREGLSLDRRPSVRRALSLLRTGVPGRRRGAAAARSAHRRSRSAWPMHSARRRAPTT